MPPPAATPAEAAQPRGPGFRGPVFAEGHEIWTYDDGRIHLAATVLIESGLSAVFFTAENIGDTTTTLFPSAFGLRYQTESGYEDLQRLEPHEIISKLRWRELPWLIINSVGTSLEEDGVKYAVKSAQNERWAADLQQSLRSTSDSLYRKTSLAPGQQVAGFIFFNKKLRPGDPVTLRFKGLDGVVSADTQMRM